MKRKQGELPLTILLKRKSIRNYPGGVVVGVYYSHEMEQSFAISSTKKTDSINMAEDENE